MQTRMEKYNDAHEEIGSRSKRNEDLYKKISDLDIDRYTVKANATVLGSNANAIDVEHIKKILDSKYNADTPKRKSIIIPENDDEVTLDTIETKEYDINAILEKAKEQENVDYEKERFKKIRDTQYDILKDLNINKDNSNKSSNQDDDVPDKDELMKLINTITQKELENQKKNENEAFDLFPELKGSEDTVVLEAMGDNLENSYISSQSPKVTFEKEEDNSEESSDETLDKSFYTTSTVFTKSDFDDFDDLKKEVKGHKLALIIITLIVIIALVVGIFLLLNNFLGLNFFK